MNILFQLIAAAGLTFAIQNKIPFIHKKVDLLDSMLVCTYCTGFHAGWIMYLLLNWQSMVVTDLIGFAFASSIFSYGLDEAIKYLEEGGSYGDDSE